MADASRVLNADRGDHRALDPKADPSRRCMKPEDWPAADRTAWEAAMTPGGLLDEAGLAAHWRSATRKSVQDAYGRDVPRRAHGRDRTQARAAALRLSSGLGPRVNPKTDAPSSHM